MIDTTSTKIFSHNTISAPKDFIPVIPFFHNTVYIKRAPLMLDRLNSLCQTDKLHKGLCPFGAGIIKFKS